jgi:uncharacterized protein DUF5818
MKRLAFVLALTGIPMVADSSKTYVGVVHENQSVNAHPAAQCAVIKGPRFVLQTENEAWVLSDEKTAAEFVGRKVAVRGTLRDGNRLQIIEIKPVQ